MQVLGTTDEESLEQFRLSPGTLMERLWEQIVWQRPGDETSSCWWIANAGEPDKTAPVKLISRSLQCLRLELHTTRCATSIKLRQTYERRLEENGLAVGVLLNNAQLWRHVRGPDPELLYRPSEIDLKNARLAVHRLRCMLAAHGPNAHDGLDVYADEIFRAVNSLKQVTWDAIRRERFFLTPRGLFDELVRNAQTHMSRHADESARRQARLDEDDEKSEPPDMMTQDSAHEYAHHLPEIRPRDSLINLDVFKNKNRRRPHNWQRAVRQASEVLLDEMHVLLSLHYDAVHLKNWKAKQKNVEKKAPERKGDEYKVFRTVIETHRQRLNIRLELPPSVCRIFQKPEDEASWPNLETFRCVICSLLEAETEIAFDAEELTSLAISIEKSGSLVYPDEVGAGSKLKEGSRVILACSPESTASLADVLEVRRQVLGAIREVSKDMEDFVSLRVLQRPRHTVLAPPLDPMAKLLFEGVSLQELAEENSKTKEELFDAMLLVLWDALFLNQCEKWTFDNVANLPSDECLELGRWFLRGQNHSSKALVDGICCQCGALLHGACNQRSALSNKCSGPPTNRDGQPLFHEDGTPKTEAQPPFLLRWSPAFYAQEAPAVFAHDPETNTLSLQPNVQEPWLVKDVRKNTTDTWLYCQSCKRRWFPDGCPQNHVPFRDAASKAFLKPVRRSEKYEPCATEPIEPQSQLPEPEPEDNILSTPDEYSRTAHDNDDDDLTAHDKILDDENVDVESEILDLPEPIIERPTMQEYQSRWDTSLAWHARSSPGEFACDNLCPTPVPQLWQEIVFLTCPLYQFLL